MPVLGLHIDGGQGNLDTGIANATDVGDHLATARHERKLNLKEQILRCLLVNVDATVDTASEETEVDTGVILSRGLPLQILVDNLRRCVALAIGTSERIVQRVGECLLSVVGTDTVAVTCDTERETELQVAYPVDLLHERLL